MKVAGREKLEEFKLQHPDAAGPLDAWVREVRAARWQTAEEIRNRYLDARVDTGMRAEFLIVQRRYELDVKISFPTQTVFVVNIGMRAETNTCSS